LLKLQVYISNENLIFLKGVAYLNEPRGAVAQNTALHSLCYVAKVGVAKG